jgi:Virulence-associated protein E/Primase C terminal 2 (PriCT-2)/Bifunctional DNA primase/polymerase, N-terminal
VPFTLGSKGPTSPGWQLRNHCITDPDVACELDGNIGLAHAYSGTCAIDIDDMEASRRWLAEHSVDLDALWNSATAVRLSSGRENRGKLIYRIPTVLPSKKIIENKQNIIDFRCGNRTGTTVQDVLPPSIHPDTGKSYEWQYGDDDIGHWSILPEIPADLFALWQKLVSTPVPDARTDTVATITSVGLGKARAMLFDNDPDCDRTRWLEIGMALHHGSQGGLDGLDLWNEWSAHAKTKYAGRQDLETVWRSFHLDTPNPVTLDSLRVDTAANVEEFEPVVIDHESTAPARTPSDLTEVVNSLRRDKNGQTFAILPNLTAVLSIPELSGQHIAYDAFTDLLVCSQYGSELWRPIRDTDYTATRLWLENIGRFHPVSKDLVRDTIYYIAESNKVDTAQKWLTSLKWDGVHRIRNFFPLYMGTIATEYEYSCGEYIWTALAGRVMEPGCQADMTPILVGDQGVGKSRGVQAMAPDVKHYAKIKLGEQEEQVARKMRGILIGEIDELRGMQSDLDEVKAFITRSHEQWVPKYVEFATTYPRRIVFIGTTNEGEFLRDTENRRWLPLKVSAVDVEAIKQDRDQLWAEGLQVWMDNGISWTRAELLAKHAQDDYKIVDNWSEIVEQWLRDNTAGMKMIRTHDVMVSAIGLDTRHITRAHELRVARLLIDLGYERTTKRDAQGKNVRVWIKALDKRKKRA